MCTRNPVHPEPSDACDLRPRRGLTLKTERSLVTNRSRGGEQTCLLPDVTPTGGRAAEEQGPACSQRGKRARATAWRGSRATELCALLYVPRATRRSFDVPFPQVSEALRPHTHGAPMRGPPLPCPVPDTGDRTDQGPRGGEAEGGECHRTPGRCGSGSGATVPGRRCEERGQGPGGVTGWRMETR